MSDALQRVFVFETTTAALWGEEVASSRRIPAEVVPAPASSKAKCDMALTTFPAHWADLDRALTEEGVPHRAWPE